MAQIPLSGVKVCLFDAYGTLFDFASAVRDCEEVPRDAVGKLAALWRDKQLQYTWLRAAQDRHADFWQVTADALDFALETLAIERSGLHDRLMQLYLTLDVFPEVPRVLAQLKGAGLRTAILSNGTPEMLEAVVGSAKLGRLIDTILSVGRSASTNPIQGLSARRGPARGAGLQHRVNRQIPGTLTRPRHSACRWWCNRYGQRRDRLPARPAAR